MSRTLFTALLLAVPLTLAGCLNATDDAPAPAPAAGASPDTPRADAPAANATATPIKAPNAKYSAGSGTTRTDVHPFTIPGQEAREAEHLAFQGEYGAEDCTIPVAHEIAGDRWQAHAFHDALRPGDAVMATVTFTYENTDAAYANLHVWASVPGRYVIDESDVDSGRITQTLEFQFAYPEEDGSAYVGVACWWAETLEPIPYTIDVHLAFAENVVPAGTPVLVNVDEGIRELRVTGAPARADARATGHYRLFAPDDSLVGEFALNSDEGVDAVSVPGPGAYVLIVDHSENGMLALGADAPPADPVLEVLDVDWAVHAVYAQAQAAPADELVAFDVTRVPLRQGVWVRPAEENGVALGKAVVMDLAGPKGLVQHYRIPSFVNYRWPGSQYGPFLSAPDMQGWEYAYDHHALTVGGHTFTMRAEEFQGEVFRYFVTYLRPGESGAPVPPELAGSGSDAASRDAAGVRALALAFPAT